MGIGIHSPSICGIHQGIYWPGKPTGFLCHMRARQDLSKHLAALSARAGNPPGNFAFDPQNATALLREMIGPKHNFILAAGYHTLASSRAVFEGSSRQFKFLELPVLITFSFAFILSPHSKSTLILHRSRTGSTCSGLEDMRVICLRLGNWRSSASVMVLRSKAPSSPSQNGQSWV